MALPAAVQTQINAINANLNKVVADRETITGLFEDRLGASVWSRLSAANQSAAKTAIVNDIQSAIDGLQAAKDALAAM